MDLSKLNKITEDKKKRLGQGYGSGKGGHTVGRGTKGQKARGSRKVHLGFEGGQVPLYKRLPQIGGFSRKWKSKPLAVNVEVLNVFDDKATVTPEGLVEKGIIKKVPSASVKILGNGSIKKNLILTGFSFSAKAREIIEESGSKIND